MRKRQVKLEVAAIMAVMMACSTAIAPCRPTLTAKAASQKQVKLNVKSKTLKEGQTGYKLKLVNNARGWKIKKVSTTNEEVCKPYSRKKTHVLLKAKGKGSAVIKVKAVRTVLKTGEGKTTKSKQLSCRVRVKADTSKTPDTEPALSKDVTASSQEQLEAALKSTYTETLRFQTDAEGTFTIPKADYKGIDLIVDAPNADVVNNGTFKSITVHAIKDSTWLENAVGNILNILAKAARIIVQPEADVSGITFAQAGANVTLEVNGKVKDLSFEAPDANAKVSAAQGSTIENMSVAQAAQRAKVDMDVNGSIGDVKLAAPQSDINVAVADEGTVGRVALDAAADSAKVGLDVKGTVSDVALDAEKADVKVAVNDNGKVSSVTISKEMDVAVSGTAKAAIAVKVSAEATVSASTNVELESSVSLNLILEKGAEGSSIKVSGNTAKVGIKIQNNTESSISVTTPNGKYTVSKNSNRDLTVNAPSASGSPSSGGSSFGGSSSGSSSSDGSSSGGSSSGGSSSGGSGTEDDKTNTDTKGMVADQQYLTLNVGEEKEVKITANPGKIENEQWNILYWHECSGNIECLPFYTKEGLGGLKIKALKPGISYAFIFGNVVGSEEDSPVIYPNQTKAVVVRVLGDEVKETPSAAIKLTADAATVEKGEKINISAQIDNAPEGSEIESVEFWKAHNVNRPTEVLEFEKTSNMAGTMTGMAMGKDEVVAFAVVKLPDGSKEYIVSDVLEIEVTDSSPDPAPEDTRFESYVSINPAEQLLQVGDEGRLMIKFGEVHANTARILKVKWSSDDQGVVTVGKEETKYTAENTVTAVGIGNTTVRMEVTFATAAGTFVRNAGINLTVEAAPPVPKLTIAPHVREITGSAIEEYEHEGKGYTQEDENKMAVEFLKENFTMEAEGSTAEFADYSINGWDNGLNIPGLKNVYLKNYNYGFVIQDSMQAGTVQIPITFWVKREGVSSKDSYTATVNVTFTKTSDNKWEAKCEVTDIQAKRQ